MKKIKPGTKKKIRKEMGKYRSREGMKRKREKTWLKGRLKERRMEKTTKKKRYEDNQTWKENKKISENKNRESEWKEKARKTWI